MKIALLALTVLIPLRADGPADAVQETPTTLVPFQSIGPGSPHFGGVTVSCEANPTQGIEMTWMLLAPDLGLQDHTMLEEQAFVPMVRFTLVHNIHVPGDLLPTWYGFIGSLEEFEDPSSGPCNQVPKPPQATPEFSNGCSSLLLRVGQDGLLLPSTSPRLLTFGLCNAPPTVRVRLDG
jgi:hypothetical protein